jgi:hypothetical protein
MASRNFKFPKTILKKDMKKQGVIPAINIHYEYRLLYLETISMNLSTIDLCFFKLSMKIGAILL